MIEVNDLTFAYGNDPPIFKAFNLKISPGEAWAVIGPSGCGKTTFLYLLAGLQVPDSGEIRIAGVPVVRPRPGTGLVLQDHGLLPWATVYDNVYLGIKIRRFYGPDGRHAPPDIPADKTRAEQQVSFWLRRLGIDALVKKYPLQLSRGQRQRAAIARTLVLGPDLLLLDEPFSALDAPTRDDLQTTIGEFNRDSGLTTIIVTHDIEEAVTMGQKILVLDGTANAKPRVIENPPFGNGMRRDTNKFHARCALLRKILEDLT
ncbi:MAG: ATP-binding cassette domain-containing protein [Desulfatiglandaceae bacterium]|jgi:NitT/TauT family transport system ATP-binding protein